MLDTMLCLLCHREFSKRQEEGDKRWTTRRYCSKSCAGKSTKGVVFSEEIREKIRQGHLGKKFTEEHRRKIGDGNRGKKLGLEQRALLSKIASCRRLTDETKVKIGDAVRGERHPNWKGGVTYPIFALRKTKEYRHWRNAVLERDGYRCRKCHKSNSRFDAHHIFSFTLFPELRFEVSNGITVCVRCHAKYKDQLCQLVLV